MTSPRMVSSNGRTGTARLRLIALLIVLLTAPACGRSGGEGSPTASVTSTTLGSPPGAQSSSPGAREVQITPSPIPVGANETSVEVTVTWSGQPAGKRLFVSMCRRAHDDPKFSWIQDCAPQTEVTVNPVDQPGSGSLSFTLLHNNDMDELGWSCNAPGVAPAEKVQALETCYVRVTNDAQANETDARSAQFSFTLRSP